MACRPPSSITWCSIGPDVVILDLRKDRYLCLTDRLAAALQALAGGADPHTVPAAEVAALQGAGLLAGTLGDTPPTGCSPPAAPTVSLLDAGHRRPPAGRQIAAALNIERAGLLLRIRGLEAVIAQLRQRKRETAPVARIPGPGHVASVLAHSGPGWFRDSNGECLRRSLALMRALLAQAMAPDLVIGVKLRPFGAHCWLQTDDLLLNDYYETVREFTPILVL